MKEHNIEIVRFVLVGLCATAVRVLHELHKTGKIIRDKAIARLGIGVILSYFAGIRIDPSISVVSYNIYGPSIFVIAFMGVEVVDFILSKDIKFFISLFLQNVKK